MSLGQLPCWEYNSLRYNFTNTESKKTSRWLVLICLFNESCLNCREKLGQDSSLTEENIFLLALPSTTTNSNGAHDGDLGLLQWRLEHHLSLQVPPELKRDLDFQLDLPLEFCLPKLIANLQFFIMQNWAYYTWASHSLTGGTFT